MKNIDLVENGLELLKEFEGKETAVSLTTLLQRYDTGSSKLHAYLIASRQPANESDHSDLLQLYRKMEARFNESELQDLCFRLGVVYEDLNGQNRLDRIRGLITYMERRNRQPELVAHCVQLRPDTDWDVMETSGGETAVLSKLDMAVIIDIARPALRNVAAYLDDTGIDANFVVFRHAQPGQFFSVNDDWSRLAITFGNVMDRVKREFNGAKVHFFMAGPGGLLFAMGCIWGTVDEAVVYHYENNTYHPVLPITRELRQIVSDWN